MIYFDYTSTTKIDNDVLDTFIKAENNFYANATALHKLGQEANFLYEKASLEILTILDITNHDIIYTANATEANNLAILGYVRKYQSGRIITTKIEHPSVFEVFKQLENEGYEVVYLNVTSDGIIDPVELAAKLTKDTILVSIMWVNNIVGSIQPIREVIKLIRRSSKAKLHVDLVQGICKIEPDFSFNDIDLMTISFHKIYGPKGIGALFIKKGIALEKVLYGSTFQKAIKPGTCSTSLIAAADKAIKKFYPLTKRHYEYVNDLRNYLYNKLKALDNVVINSNIHYTSPYIINVSFPKISGETLVHILEENEIYVSTGSSCSSKLKRLEKTIYAMTASDELAGSSIRISLAHLSTKKEIEQLIEVLKEV